MQIILKENIDNLGFKDDLVKVKNGYGRNYLIPQGKAVLATASAKKILAENLKQKAFKEKKKVHRTYETMRRSPSPMSPRSRVVTASSSALDRTSASRGPSSRDL